MLRLKRTVGDGILLLDGGHRALLRLIGVYPSQVTFNMRHGGTERVMTVTLGARTTFLLGAQTVQVALESTQGMKASLGIDAPSSISIVRAELPLATGRNQ